MKLHLEKVKHIFIAADMKRKIRQGKRIWFDYLGAANHNQSLINAVPLLTGTGDFWLLGFPSGPFRPALCNLIP